MKKSMIGAFSLLVGAGVGAVATDNLKRKQIEDWKSMSDKHLALFRMMDQWVRVKQQGKNLADYLEQEGYKRIAIYGMSFAGETLVSELEGSGIQIAYAIDKRAEAIYSELEIVSPEDELEEVDAIVVTPITFFDQIEDILMDKVNCPIISLEDILYEV